MFTFKNFTSSTLTTPMTDEFFFNETLSTTMSLTNRIVSSVNQTFNSSDSILSDSFVKYSNQSCTQLKHDYISQKSLYKFVRYVSHNLNRFFLFPAIILNLCAFYILRRTRMNRSSSIAFYMQTLALCDVAFFTLRVLFSEISSSPAGQQILTNGLCKFLFLMVNAVNYTTVWLIAAMNCDKFLAVCLPLRVSDLLSRKKAYAVVLAVICCSMLVASVHANRTVLKSNGYCWLDTPQDEKLVFILDAFFWCFIPFIVISILNAAIFLALLRARREASHLHETTSISSTRTSANNFLRTTSNSSPNKIQFRSSMVNANRARIQSQNLQITIMLITISISFFVLTLPNAIYYLLILLRVLIESWKVVKCDAHVYRNLDAYLRTSAVVYLISSITSDLMHVVNFFLYFISGARFRSEFRRLIFYQLCPWCWKNRKSISGKDGTPNERSFVRPSGVATMRTLTSMPMAPSPSQRTLTIKDKQTAMTTNNILSSNTNSAHDANKSTSLSAKIKRNSSNPLITTTSKEHLETKENENLLQDQ